MNTQHTPGPWHLGNGGGIARDHAICSGPYILAKVIGQGYPVGKGWGENSAANARLIAAAPNLLEALRALVACLNAPHRTEAAIGIHMQTANAAIAKAEGRDHA